VFVFALGMVPMALAAQVPDVRWAVGAYDVALLVLVALDFWLAPDPRAITFERHVAPRLAIGEREPVTIQAESGLPRALVVQVRDEPPPGFQAEGRLLTLSLPARGRARGTYAVTPSARGDYSFAGLTVRAGGPLRLVQRQWRLASQMPVQVYPNFRLAGRMEPWVGGPISCGPVCIPCGDGARGAPRIVARLRPGDDTRHMDWKATARRASPSCANTRWSGTRTSCYAGRRTDDDGTGGESHQAGRRGERRPLVTHAAVTHGTRWASWCLGRTCWPTSLREPAGRRSDGAGVAVRRAAEPGRA
jgi:hypothetical protein